MEKSKQIILGMDSSGPTLMTCAFDGHKTYTVRKTGIKQERFLLPQIEKLLAKAGAQLPDIKKIFFVRGPGRFTGIRISLTFASMLSYLNGTQTASATVFEILRQQVDQSAEYAAWKKQNPAGLLAVVLHAFREEYFLQFFGAEAQGPFWLSKEDLLAKLKERTEPLYCAGTDREGTSLQELLSGIACTLAPMKDCVIRPQTLIDMSADEAYQKNALEPLYLKPARFELGK